MHEIQPRVIGACSIGVGEVELTPAAPHLFALLLAFSLAPRDPWTRRGLQELLFAVTAERAAAHRLRQLIYRLRGLGVVLQESSTGVVRLANPVADPLDLLDAGDLVAPPRASVRLDPLALYTPRMPAPFLDWLEQRRDVLRSALAARRLGELRAARERQDWTTCARLAGALYAIDPVDEEIVIAVAESSAMLGRRDAALDVIDQFLRDTGDALDARPALRRLRTRVASTRIPRREGTLRGRTECLSFLSSQWERATAGAGAQVCAILGAPGMGKSRVGETFSSAMRLGGAQVIHHRCDAHACQTPLALFAQLVPDLRRRRGSIGADPALREVLDQLAPGPAATAAPASTRAPHTAEERRDEMKRAIVDLLESVSAEQPVLLVVDDAHLLDEPSRAVVRWIADSANTAQLLVVLLCRPRPDGRTLLSDSRRFASYTLRPLDAADSRSLLAELAEPNPLTEAQMSWAIAQADGNAFYLHALAQHPSEDVAMPAHIRSLAQTGYLGTSTDARTVMDSCLLLDTLATPDRVARVAGMDSRVLLAAVRELEYADLLRYENGIFVGPHAIIRDVLDDLMPSAARALLNHRIAQLLSAECDDPARARVVGWAAVRSWLACGEPATAVELALRVANEAAALGEPAAGAILLSQIPRDVITTDSQRILLETIMVLAEAGKCLTLLTGVLAERRDLAVRHSEGSTAAAALTLKTVASAHAAGSAYDVAQVKRIAEDHTIASPVRADAAARIIATADLHFDSQAARTAFSQLSEHLRPDLVDDLPFVRAQLVYHTTFGSVRTAYSLINKLVAMFPTPTLSSDNRISRCYACFALLRLGYYLECARLAEESWEYMNSRSHHLAAAFFGSLAAEAHIDLGDFERARAILSALRASSIQRRYPGDAQALEYSGRIVIAIIDGDYVEAQRLVAEVARGHLSLTTPRLRAVLLAYTLRIALLRGSVDNHESEYRELRSLHARGKHLGGGDTIAESLWVWQSSTGDTDGASELLRDYLRIRREPNEGEALFRTNTRTDSAWLTIKWQSHITSE